MKPCGWAGAEGIDHKEQEEYPEKKGEPATAAVVGGRFRDIRSLFHGGRVASEKRRGNSVSSCPYGAAVCTDLRQREAGLCLECWAGTLERANAVSEWLKPA